MYRHIKYGAILLIMTVLSFSACAGQEENHILPEDGSLGSIPGQDSSENPVVKDDTGEADSAGEDYTVNKLAGYKPGDYDSADTPILVAKNQDENTLTFLNLDLGRRYTLTMDGTTKFTNKYGEGISLDQIAVGSIVDVTFIKSVKHLTGMQLSGQAWSYESVENYEINSLRNEVTIGEQVYKLSKNTQYLSGGRSIDKMDINAADVLSFQGIDKTVLSISVEKGHGYLRLANDENFVGGWIEIGQSRIQRITEDMLLTVPEGSYQVNISNNGSGGVKNVIINRNEEITLDIGDLEVAAPKTGMVLFSLSPTQAMLYIDGTETDASQPVVLEYGIHQLIVKASGYKSITQYLRVGQESIGINIVLEAMDADSSESSKSSTSSTTTSADTTTDYYKVNIDAPEGVEVFQDGSYVGISPCSFKKEAGTHVLTLRKNGYITRSYTIQVDSEDKDISLSFADLVPSVSSSDALSSLVSDALNVLGD
ncbi:MAG: PEGA domain-containing protein [Lachnoclostridium sp.]|nr:PEGA domain-containing protein [Lachnospira sp.]MCM1248882.1 PEGA domain-containing protein [Lachnoclostridium sp.]MCM1535378.1 PEGA domain-containing protein [Clostridium sp.]